MKTKTPKLFQLSKVIIFILLVSSYGVLKGFLAQIIFAVALAMYILELYKLKGSSR